MEKVRRLDLFNEKLGSVKKTDAGFLRLKIRATRAGVFKYLMPDGSMRRELRPPEEVFKEDSMETLAGVPITIKHPTELVTSKNFSTHSVGMTGDVVEKIEDTFLDITGTISKSRAVAMVEDKMHKKLNQEVSCGYTADIEKKPGIWNGEAYDVIQRNISYNHVALVDRGRAGSNVKLRLDADQAITYDENIKIGEDSMEKVTINGNEFEVSPELAKVLRADAQETVVIEGANFEVSPKLAAAIKKLVKMADKNDMGMKKKKMDELEDELATVKKDKDTLEAKKDSLEDEVKELKEKANERLDADKLDALVEERTNICNVASEIIGDEFKKDGLSNLEIKKKVIGHINSELKLDEKSEDYINARFDAVTENTEIYEDKLKKVLENKNRKDGKDKETKLDSEAARKRMIEESRNLYNEPLATTKK